VLSWNHFCHLCPNCTPISDAGIRLFYKLLWLSFRLSDFMASFALLRGGSPGYFLLRLNRIVIIRTTQACSTRDEIEAPSSLEFIALYVTMSRLDYVWFCLFIFGYDAYNLVTLYR
jgi:hypothetical protein